MLYDIGTKKMEDGRSISEESLELLHRQAHRLRLEDRPTWGEIASTVGDPSVDGDELVEAL